MTQDTTPSPSPSARPEPPSAAASAGLTLFVETLQQAGLLDDMDDGWLEGYAPRPGETREVSRRLDLLAAWYHASARSADGDGGAQARRDGDRFFLHLADDPADATALVARLDSVTPELPRIHLERLGSPEGPLVLRAGRAIAPILDDEASGLDTNEIDLSEVEDAPETVSVRSLVAAVNALLGKARIGERLVPLRADATREAYVGIARDEARALFVAGLLDDERFESVEDLAGWA